MNLLDRPFVNRLGIHAPVKLPAPTVIEIIEQVSRKTGVPIEDLIGPKRFRRMVSARQYAMWRAVQETGKSTTIIARAFGRDHTTVLHAVKAHEQRARREAIINDRA